MVIWLYYNSPDGCLAPCPLVYLRASDLTQGKNCIGITHTPLGPGIPRGRSGPGNYQNPIRGPFTGENKVRVLWELQSSSLCTFLHMYFFYICTFFFTYVQIISIGRGGGGWLP